MPDVTTDADYETNVAATFRRPGPYVRYTRKVGDEPDPLADYFLDADDLAWLAGNDILLAEDVQSALTHEAFETVINTFERKTGFAKEPLAQFTAGQEVAGMFPTWPPAVAATISSELYAYWLSKRGAAIVAF